MKKLSRREYLAIREYKRRIKDKFEDAEVVLFGSKARGEGDVYSDIDILVLLDRKVDNSVEEEIFDIGFEVELKYDVVFGVVVYTKRFWDSVGKLLPLHENIEREGVVI
ncbi:nucleotidyltransferase domain-containing protein [Methanophagales archaeon]|nr:MAG: nucleotidyltransferase domain-containing protein [Methanophagales archaeon]